MDELDAIGANRAVIGRGGTSDEASRTTLALMQCMDRVRQDVVNIVRLTDEANLFQRR